ncbi:MAG: tripartite tricarboxylate transporter permease [Archaeoglobus sp.]|nr:tripartite tricarboxylate transporter permease [Archaeoglobus sp.]
MLEALLLGVALGIISGLTPGVHNNTFSALILAYLSTLSNFFTPEEVAVIIFANAITHTFIDILPSIFIGIPDEDTALSILPSHEMVLVGRGFQAVSISALSSMISFISSLPIFLTFILILPLIWRLISALTPFFLIFVITLLIFSEKPEIYSGRLNIWLRRSYSLSIILLSGGIGYFAFKYSFLAEVRAGGNVFIPMMLGFFAIPVVLMGMRNTSEIPKQKIAIEFPRLDKVLIGSLSGAMVSLFPGVSSGVAAAISTAKLKSKEAYISAISAANTSNAILCFAVLFSTGLTRSGAANSFRFVVGYDLTHNEILNLILIAVIVASVSFLITLALGAVLSRFLVKTERISKLSLLIFIFIFLYTLFMTGLIGLLILLACSLTGMLALKLGVKRVACMGSIIIPVLIYRLF